MKKKKMNGNTVLLIITIVLFFVMAAAASGGQGEQIGMKRGGIDLLVMPPPLNDKLSPRPPRSVDQVTGRA